MAVRACRDRRDEQGAYPEVELIKFVLVELSTSFVWFRAAVAMATGMGGLSSSDMCHLLITGAVRDRVGFGL